MANNDITRPERPQDFEPLDHLRDVVTHKINSSTVTLNDVITTLNKAQIRMVSHLEPMKKLSLPHDLDVARLKPRPSPRIQVFSIYRVFGIAELLEKILVELPAPTILRCRTVNKFFKAIIDGTKSVQQSLFRIPLPAISHGQEPRLSPFIEMLNLNNPWAPSPRLSTARYKFRFDWIALYPPDQEYDGSTDPAQDGYELCLRLGDDVHGNTSSSVDKEMCSMVLCQPPREVTVTYRDTKYVVRATTLDGVLEELMEKIEPGQQSGD